MRGTPAIVNGEITRPVRSEAEARADARKKRLAEVYREMRIEREEQEDAEAEEGYRRHAQAIWSER